MFLIFHHKNNYLWAIRQNKSYNVTVNNTSLLCACEASRAVHRIQNKPRDDRCIPRHQRSDWLADTASSSGVVYWRPTYFTLRAHYNVVT